VWDGYLLVKPLMRPRAIIVVDILAQHVPQMAFAEDEQPGQALGAVGAYLALGIGVRIGCSKQRMDHVDACRLKDDIKGWDELGVRVVDQKVADRLSVLQAPHDLLGTQRASGWRVQPAK
jgi:hypothetical protein